MTSQEIRAAVALSPKLQEMLAAGNDSDIATVLGISHNDVGAAYEAERYVDAVNRHLARMSEDEKMATEEEKAAMQKVAASYVNELAYVEVRKTEQQARETKIAEAKLEVTRG